MYTVSNEFKQYINTYGKRVTARISFDDEILLGESIYKIDKSYSSDFYRSAMQQLEGEIKGRFNLTNKVLHVEVGLSLDTSDIEWVDYGYFIVKDHERIIGSSGTPDKTTFTAYDIMLNAHVLYDVSALGITFPISVFSLFQAVAIFLGTTVINTSIVNGSQIIEEDKWTNVENVTYRNVLDEIAATSGSAIIVHENKLLAKHVDTNLTELQIGVLPQLHENNMKSLNLSEEYGPVNILNLTREASHDNYPLPPDWQDIPVNDRVEIVIPDNQIMDKKREDYAPLLFDSIEGLKYYPFESSLSGVGYLEPMDTVNVIDMNGISHVSVCMTNQITIKTGFVETISSVIPGYSQEKYALVTDSRRQFLKVYFLVDQQNGQIQSLIQQVGDRSDKTTSITQDIDSITATVTNINNINIWYNANGELDYDGWTFEQDGLLPSNDLLPSEYLLPMTVSSPIFTSKIYPESLSEYGIEFDTIGYAFSKKARVVQGSDQYSIRMRRMDAYPNLRISVIEYSDDSDTPSKTTQIISTTAPNVYENASIALEASTLFIKIAVYNPTETIHGLTENMFNRGMPRAWFESASDVKAYAESQFIIFSEKIDLSNQSIDSLTGRIDNTLLRITADKGVEIWSTSGNGLTIYDANGNKTVELKTDGTIKAINGEFVDATITGNLNAGKVGNLVVTESGITFPDGKLKLDSSLNAILVGTLQLKHSTFDWSGNAADSFLLTGTGTTSVFEVKATTTGIISVSDGSSHAIQLISSAIGGSANGMTISDSTSATEFILDQTSHKGALTNIGYLNGYTVSRRASDGALILS